MGDPQMWINTLTTCIAEYSPPAPNSFQDVANQINADYANGLMDTQWMYYEFPYNTPVPNQDTYYQFVGSAVLYLCNATVYGAVTTTGTLFMTDYPDYATNNGRMWFIKLSAPTIPWPPPNYPPS